MIQIWKFSIESSKKVFDVEMPEGAKVLCVQLKDGNPCVWAECDVRKPFQKRSFEIFGTGWEIPCDMGVERKYVGTYQTTSGIGTLVWHLYERLS